MKIHEYQAKEILRTRGILTPSGIVVDRPDAPLTTAEKFGFPLAIKAQIHVGGRGKAGAIRIVSDQRQLRTGLTEILAMTVKGLAVKKVLIEKALDIKKQFYLGVIVDRLMQSNALVVSADGGVDIEETAKLYPKKILRVLLKDAQKIEKKDLDGLVSFLKLESSLSGGFIEIVKALFAAYLSLDAQLLEINPLVLTNDGQWIACDAKMVIDDNALFRQKELCALKEEEEDNLLEKEAHRRNLAYVKLPGNVGVIGNGAGLVMATMDEVKRSGGLPADFLDIGGGAKKEVMENALQIIYMDKEVKGIFINIFGGITRCDEVALGITSILRNAPRKIPLVVRLAGTQCEEAKKILGQSNLIAVGTMEEGAKKIVSLVNKI